MRLKYNHQYDSNITFNYQWDCRKREQVGLFQFLPGRRGIPRCQKSLHHSFYFNVYFVSSFRYSKGLNEFTPFLCDNKHFNQQAFRSPSQSGWSIQCFDEFVGSTLWSDSTYLARFPDWLISQLGRGTWSGCTWQGCGSPGGCKGSSPSNASISSLLFRWNMFKL